MTQSIAEPVSVPVTAGRASRTPDTRKRGGFFRGLWRVLVGVKDALVLIFMLLFFGLLYVGLSAGSNPAAIRDGALVMDLKGSIVEQPAEADPFAALAGGGPVLNEHRLRDIVAGLELAATDSRVKAVALDLDQFLGGGQASLADVATAIDFVKRNNKPVIAYATGYSDDAYQLAAHASEIWLNPLGLVAVTGPGGNNLYFAGLLEKLGVTANVYRVGTYKAAVEPFTRSDASPEAAIPAKGSSPSASNGASPATLTTPRTRSGINAAHARACGPPPE